MQRLVVLGATGSIGASTLDVVARHPQKFSAFALTADRNVARMLALCLQHRPRYAVMVNSQAANSLRQRLRELNCATEVLDGASALIGMAQHPEADSVMAAIVGAAGLLPSMAAARAGKRVLLANKEALVMSGELFLRAVADGGATLLPIDSEHNAVFQCLPAEKSIRGVEKVLLTASGGPFLRRDVASLATVTPDQACAHPTWNMGRKISVDSATLMNKGLEVIEASLLFRLPAQMIDVLVHPQSIVHSLVRYIDGSVLAQLGNPDMRTPIAHALAWPQRVEAGVDALDLSRIAQLQFEAVDTQRFPCLQLAYQALRSGGSAPAILNAANEIAVAAFLHNELSFTAIAEVVAECLARLPAPALTDIPALLELDGEARLLASRVVQERAAA